MSVHLRLPLVGHVCQLKAGVLISALVGYVIGSGGGGLVDGSGGDLGGGSLEKGEAIGEVMKRDGGLVEAVRIKVCGWDTILHTQPGESISPRITSCRDTHRL